jgi:hypothetical protein
MFNKLREESNINESQKSVEGDEFLQLLSD